jgi:hypothetical protein
VSPTGSVWHSAVSDRLMDQLVDLKRRHDWIFHTYLTLHISPTKERLIPDLSGVPLYLLIDRFADSPTVTLYSQPREDGYGDRQTATAGKPLRLPKPFGIGLDTARLLG